MIAILAGSVIVGYLFLVIVFCIPQSRLFTGLANSVSVIQRDDLEEKIFGYPSSRLDVFTDGALMNAALYENDESAFKRAAACYQYIYNDLSRAEGFIAYFEPREPDGFMSYQRYWHGILVVLKPLFLFFNYSDIRMINSICQVMLMCFVVCVFALKKLYRYIPAVFITYLFLMPYTLPMCIQYSPVYYIGFGSLAVLVMMYDKHFDKGGILYLFLITGILTSYFDLLTYPVFTLGIPLAGLLILAGREYKTEDVTGNRTVSDEKDIGFALLKRFIACGISWFAGYALMWAGKILISIPFFGTQAITDALNSVGQRSVSGASDEGITYTEALKTNLFMYKNSLYKWILVIYTLIVLAIIAVRLIRKKMRITFAMIPLFLCIMAIPFVWYFVTTEHAQVHAFMTYKDLTVAVFGYCCMLACLMGQTDYFQIR